MSAPLPAIDRITAHAVVIDVPDRVDGVPDHERTAIARALTFAQYAAGVGMPVVRRHERTDGGWRIQVVEASAATARARDG